jgi:DNA (cytosine-5)-methyltransferase 1
LGGVIYSISPIRVNRLVLLSTCTLDLIATATDTSSTIDGKNDAANIDQLHTIKGLIEVLKPRVVVLENTSGLVNLTENQPYFRKIIYDISSAGPGYNLRYNIINMADYGLPQERKRLIIIAAK